MTDRQPNQEAVIVTEAEKAREALAATYSRYYDDVAARDIRSGKRHTHEIVEAMLSYADEAVKAERERCAGIADAAWQPAYVRGDLTDPTKWKPGSPWDRGAVEACKRVATAIRNHTTGDPA